MRRWLRRLLGRAPRVQAQATGPSDRLDAARQRLKQTIPAPEDPEPAP